MEKINYGLLTIDKENETVSYNDEFHKYWLKDNEEACISVTTLIHKFTTFDEDFWSSYKALESILTPEQFLEVKPSLLEHHVFKEIYYEQFEIDEETFNQAKKNLLEE